MGDTLLYIVNSSKPRLSLCVAPDRAIIRRQRLDALLCETVAKVNCLVFSWGGVRHESFS